MHHKDEDAFNNHIDNLEIVNKSLHCSNHMKQRVKQDPEKFLKLAEVGREYARVWHKSAEGSKWHKEVASKQNFGVFDFGIKECLQCNTEFTVKALHSRFCSNKCKSKHRRISRVDHIVKVCPCCSNEFSTCRYKGAEFCSKKCYAKSIVNR